MSYFDLDKDPLKYKLEVYAPKTKDEIVSINPSMTDSDMVRIQKQVANTSWNSYWTQDISPFTEYVPDNKTISNDEIRQYLPEEYKNLSLEELSEKLLEDENGQEVLREAINKAKTRNVKEKYSDSYEELMRLVKEYQDQQQYPQWQARIHKPDSPKYYYHVDYSDRTD